MGKYAQLRDHEDDSYIIPMWLKGKGGKGKSKFITWFAMHMDLDQRVFKHAQSILNGGMDTYLKW